MSVLIAEALTTWRACRDEFETYREAAYQQAHEATNGVLLNKRGIAADIDPWSLFIGNEIRARAYASRELLDHWEDRARLTYERFEQAWVERRDR